jgi:hypothetical protein
MSRVVALLCKENGVWNIANVASIAEELATSPGYVLQLLVSCRRRVREFYDAMRSSHSGYASFRMTE